MPSLIEIIRHWAKDEKNTDTIAVRIYRNGHLIVRSERQLYAPFNDRHDLGALNAANTITGALLGAARRAAKFECRNHAEVK